MTSKQFLYVIIITFITVLIWVGTDISYSHSKIQPTSEIQQLLEPINPIFDNEVINNL